jgi:hypothetical protein
MVRFPNKSHGESRKFFISEKRRLSGHSYLIPTNHTTTAALSRKSANPAAITATDRPTYNVAICNSYINLKLIMTI